MVDAELEAHIRHLEKQVRDIRQQLWQEREILKAADQIGAELRHKIRSTWLPTDFLIH